MTEVNYSALVRELLNEYFEHRLTRVEYLTRRRSLMDQIDREFNGDGRYHIGSNGEFVSYVGLSDASALTPDERTIPGDRHRIK